MLRLKRHIRSIFGEEEMCDVIIVPGGLGGSLHRCVRVCVRRAGRGRGVGMFVGEFPREK